MCKFAFLDTITLENAVMTTDLYTIKPLEKHQFLSRKSCHSKHCSRIILYSQGYQFKVKPLFGTTQTAA